MSGFEGGFVTVCVFSPLSSQLPLNILDFVGNFGSSGTWCGTLSALRTYAQANCPQKPTSLWQPRRTRSCRRWPSTMTFATFITHMSIGHPKLIGPASKVLSWGDSQIAGSGVSGKRPCSTDLGNL